MLILLETTISTCLNENQYERVSQLKQLCHTVALPILEFNFESGTIEALKLLLLKHNNQLLVQYWRYVAKNVNKNILSHHNTSEPINSGILSHHPYINMFGIVYEMAIYDPLRGYDAHSMFCILKLKKTLNTGQSTLNFTPDFFILRLKHKSVLSQFYGSAVR